MPNLHVYDFIVINTSGGNTLFYICIEHTPLDLRHYAEASNKLRT